MNIDVPGLKNDVKIAAFSDLHLNAETKDSFLKKLSSQINAFQPDIIFFLGDFLCDGEIENRKRLVDFLNEFSPPLGAFAVLGNHDYAEPVSLNSAGDYDVSSKKSHLKKVFQRLFNKIVLTGKVTKRASEVKEHQELKALLKETPFTLLNNETVKVNAKGYRLNVTGLGEYVLGRAKPEIAFKNFEPKYPGIVLVHNPDMIPHLEKYPGNLILSGHTHGGQVNLPWIWKKLTLMEHARFKKGLVNEGNKTVFVSRGVGSVKPFRWNAPPELIKIQLKAKV